MQDKPKNDGNCYGIPKSKTKSVSVCVCNRNHGFNLSACYALQYRRTVNSLVVKCWCLLWMKCRIEHEIKGNPLRVGLKKGFIFYQVFFFFFLDLQVLAKSFRNMNALHPAWHTFKAKKGSRFNNILIAFDKAALLWFRSHRIVYHRFEFTGVVSILTKHVWNECKKHQIRMRTR